MAHDLQSTLLIIRSVKLKEKRTASPFKLVHKEVNSGSTFTAKKRNTHIKKKHLMSRSILNFIWHMKIMEPWKTF